MKTTKYLIIGLIFVLLFYIVKNTTVTINIKTPSLAIDSIFASTDTTSKVVAVDNTDYHKIKYVTQSSELPIEDDMVLKDKQIFSNLEKEYRNLISEKFSPKQTKTIKEIIISDSYAFDSGDGANSTGLCSTITYNNVSTSYILIASKNDDHRFTLMHECCHALFHNNIQLFNSKYKDRWDALDNQYVSNYATTNIEEDFAETGATYLLGIEPVDCKEKLKLFAEFYKETK